ncbi:MAG TPA: polymer-forming cytoskeletal protein [Candidatus Methylomirabilis sp.]|nr:polymer-forming cytoskeletal protein [Candidatus Methylomirabilis sp.]
MGIFGGSDKSTGDKPAPAKGPPPTSLSIVGMGMTVRGDLETEGVVKVEGAVEGHVSAGLQVLVAKGGVVHGDIETTEAIVGGAVKGSVVARDRVEVQAGAAIDGDVTTRRISVSEGARLNGQIRMGEGAPAGEEKAAARSQQAAGAVRPSSVGVARIAVPPRPSPQV